MTVQTARLLKEARSLFWPWIIVLLLGVTPAFAGEFSLGSIPVSQLALFGVLIGIPLIAALPFGLEFQHGTMPVLLSQPVDRRKIWTEKVVTALAFATSAAVLSYLTWHTAFADDRRLEWMWVVFIVLAVSSAAYWALVGKSMITGMALNLIAAGALIGMALSFMTIAGAAEVSAPIAILAIPISAFMFWLGRRKFIRFESTGAAAGIDLMERGLGGAGVLFRATRTNASLNMIRRELRLLAPVWLFAVVAVLFLMCLTPIRLITTGTRPLLSAIAASLSATVIGISLALAPLLAGTLSIGEERTAGTQIWNLILPLSNRRQWLLKLVAGFTTCLACQVFVLFAAWVFGRWAFTPEANVFFNSIQNRVSEASLTTVIFLSAFWCACALRGTVRASLLAFPVVALITAAGTIGVQIGRIVGVPALNSILITWFHPYLFSGQLFSVFRSTSPIVATVPMLAFAMFQSYRLFRYDLTSEQSIVIRRLVSLLIVGLLSGVAIYTALDFPARANRQLTTVLSELHDAVARLGPANLPMHVSLDQLTQTNPLSTTSRRWLRDSDITVYPIEPAVPSPDAKTSAFYISVKFPNGNDCRATRSSNIPGLRIVGNIFSSCESPDFRHRQITRTRFLPAEVAQTMRIHEVKPVAPSDKAATVKLRVFIQSDGTVKWIYPLSGDEPFITAAVNAVQQWRYQPMQMLGWPANAMTEVTINFP